MWTTLGLVHHFRSMYDYVLLYVVLLCLNVFSKKGFSNEGTVSKLYELHVNLDEPGVVEFGAKLSSCLCSRSFTLPDRFI